MYELKLPDLGEGIHEAEILRWHVSAGQPIDKDAPLVDVETDKAAVTIPCPVAGVVVRLGAEVGQVLKVGQVVAVIDEGKSSAAAPGAGRAATASQPAAAMDAPGVERPPVLTARPVDPQASTAGRSPVPAAPATRRLARELGVALGSVGATGPGGRVTSDDVRAAATGTRGAGTGAEVSPETQPATSSAQPPEKISSPTGWSGIPLLEVERLPDFSVFGPVDIEPLRSIRRKVARKMTQSSVLIAQVSHIDEADITELDTLRRRERERRVGQPGGRLTLMAFVLKALVTGLKQYRMFNASLDALGEELVYKRYYNIGVAVDSPKGLVVPVLKGADRLSVLELAAALEVLANRAREDRLEADDFRGGTFTVSNIGNLGGFSPNPLVNYPEVALLGMGRAEPKPVVVGGEVQIRTRLPLVLSFDHRIADGGEAARFMNDLGRRLADPAVLLVET